MSKITLYSKVVPIILIVSILFTACDIPDISKFSETSAEMTRGIRKGVKNTDVLLDSVSTNPLFESDLQTAFKTEQKKFQKEFKTTLKALDSLDAYLEALNNLATAQKKSKENSEATVNAVGSLVSAVSGFTIPNTAVKLASGLLGLYEKARLEKDFKKRVNLVAEIVEGKTYPVMKDGATIYVSKCTDDAVDVVLKSSDTPQKKATDIQKLGCGVIGYLKINIQFLKDTNTEVSENIRARLSSKNRILVTYYQNLLSNDERIQNELAQILDYKNIVATAGQFQSSRELVFKVNKVRTENEYQKKLDAATTARERTRLQVERNSKIRTLEREKNNEISQKTSRYNSAANSTVNSIISLDDNLLQLSNDLDQFDRNCTPNCNSIESQQNRRFLIISHLETREAELKEKTKAFDIDKKRIEPAFKTVEAELTLINDKENQLDSLLDSGLAALDSWRDTHINMRVALNTKKPLTVSVLVARVREMWEILKPIAEE